MAVIIVVVIVLLTVTAFFYVRQPQFGDAPSGKRLELIRKSPSYKDGKFQTLVPPLCLRKATATQK